jgi:hypothetical protein
VTNLDLTELQAHRDGIGHLAEDPMHAGQTVWRLPDLDDGEVRYRLQISHADAPLWQCDGCRKLTLGPDPDRCVGCGRDDGALSPLLYEKAATCRSWAGSNYTGDCQIAHWDGCVCPDGGVS